MADLTELQSAITVKIAGANSSGDEQNFLNIDGLGNLAIIDASDGTVVPGTVAAYASLGAAQYNTSAPTLTNSQQAALQSTINGRLKVDTVNSDTSDRMGSGSISALNGTVEVNTQGMSTVRFLVSGTWVGTMRAEGLINNTWKLATVSDSAQAVFATATVNEEWYMQCGGFSKVRLRMSLYTSGTANVEWDTGIGVGGPQLIWNTNAASLKTTPRSDVLNLTGSAGSLNADAIASIDVGGYSAVEIQITETWVGTLTFQGSNDNSNFVSVLATDISNPTQSPITTTSINGIFYIPLCFRYFRCRMTSYTSGTATSTHMFETITSTDLQTRNVNIRNLTGTLTNRSGSTSGSINTSTQIMAINTTRQYLFIQNVGANTMWINFTSAANTTQPSIMLVSGASFAQEGNFVSTEAINVISGSASVPYTAKEA